MKTKLWFVHKYHLGNYKWRMRVKGTFEAIDKWTRLLCDRYGSEGWAYEISEADADPRKTRRLKVSAEMFEEDPELRALCGVV
jgi:hypothetical protein